MREPPLEGYTRTVVARLRYCDGVRREVIKFYMPHRPAIFKLGGDYFVMRSNKGVSEIACWVHQRWERFAATSADYKKINQPLQVMWWLMWFDALNRRPGR